jgi:hypothetical protein
MNGMCRFGNHGVNVSVGNGLFENYKLGRLIETIKYFQNYKNINFYNNAKELYNIKNSLMILDPPYYLREMAVTGDWIENDLKEMMSIIDLDNNDIIYTDINNPYGNDKFKTFIKLEKLKSISPNRHEEMFHDEILYYKI